MLEIDYDMLDPKYVKAVKNIEAKPHVKYIRYLLSKRYSPASIKDELTRLGLSAPHEPQLIIYYLAVIDPVVKETKSSKIYSDYKSKMLSKQVRMAFSRDILNFKIHLCDDYDMQTSMCKLIKKLDITDLWVGELYRFYGSAAAFPVDDETGKKIIECTTALKSVEKVVTSPKRYLVDKMLLENINDTRIAKYCQEHLKLKFSAHDISTYRSTFFNMQTQDIEGKIKTLEREQNHLKSYLEDLESGNYDDMEIGERMLIANQTRQRINEIGDNIKTLNMMYSDFAFEVHKERQMDLESMFTDVVIRAYSRFVNLDAYKDRDVVDPLYKTAKIMGFAHDKVEAIKVIGGATQSSDAHSQQIVMELYKKRLGDINKEQVEESNKELSEIGYGILNQSLLGDDIEGIDELGMNFNEEETGKEIDTENIEEE